MKLVIGTTLMLLLSGGSGYARQEPEKDKPAPKEEPKKQEEPRKGQKQEKPQEKAPEKPKQEPDKKPQDRDRAKPAQQNDRSQQQEEHNRTPQPKPAQQQERAQQQAQHGHPSQPSHTDHPNVRRVPEQQYRASFGREHHFHVQRRDDRRFQYSGFWFQYSEPWPGDWDYNDDIYIEDVDGEYYMFNQRRPGVRILVIVAE